MAALTAASARVFELHHLLLHHMEQSSPHTCPDSADAPTLPVSGAFRSQACCLSLTRRALEDEGAPERRLKAASEGTLMLRQRLYCSTTVGYPHAAAWPRSYDSVWAKEVASDSDIYHSSFMCVCTIIIIIIILLVIHIYNICIHIHIRSSPRLRRLQ